MSAQEHNVSGLPSTSAKYPSGKAPLNSSNTISKPAEQDPGKLSIEPAENHFYLPGIKEWIPESKISPYTLDIPFGIFDGKRAVPGNMHSFFTASYHHSSSFLDSAMLHTIQEMLKIEGSTPTLKCVPNSGTSIGPAQILKLNKYIDEYLKFNIIPYLLPGGKFSHLIKSYSLTRKKQLFERLKTMGARYKQILLLAGDITKHTPSSINGITELLGEDILHEKYKGYTLLHSVAINSKNFTKSGKHRTMFHYLFNKGVNINSSYIHYGTVLHMDIANEAIDTSISMIRYVQHLSMSAAPNKRFDFTVQDFEGKTVLLLAVKIMSPRIVETLLSLRCDVDIPDDQGRTPLMLALALGQPEIAKMLLLAGADHTKTDSLGKRTLDYADASQQETAEILKSIHIDPRRTVVQYSNLRRSWLTNETGRLLLLKTNKGKKEPILIHPSSIGLITRLMNEGNKPNFTARMQEILDQLSTTGAENTVLLACQQGKSSAKEILLAHIAPGSANIELENIASETEYASTSHQVPLPVKRNFTRKTDFRPNVVYVPDATTSSIALEDNSFSGNLKKILFGSPKDPMNLLFSDMFSSGGYCALASTAVTFSNQFLLSKGLNPRLANALSHAARWMLSGNKAAFAVGNSAIQFLSDYFELMTPEHASLLSNTLLTAALVILSPSISAKELIRLSLIILSNSAGNKVGENIAYRLCQWCGIFSAKQPENSGTVAELSGGTKFKAD